MNWIDGHCHLADKRIQDQVPEMILRAQKKGINQFVMAGVGPEDWAQQRDLLKKYSGLYPCFGLHPYWVADHSPEECEVAMDQLSKCLGSSIGIGEMGLDFRPHIAKESERRQLDLFQSQLELAIVSNKPVVLHIVQAFKEACRVIEVYGLPKAGGMVHSFNGSAPEAEVYLSMGLNISIGGPLCRNENLKLKQAVQVIPLSHLIIESDTPDQAVNRQNINEPSSIIEVAAEVARIKKVDLEKVLDSSAQNLESLFRLSLFKQT